MVNKKHNIPEEDSLMVEETPASYGITIPVTIPSIGNYTMKRLKDELTEIALRLVSEDQDKDSKMSMADLDAKIQKGVEDYKNGRVIRKLHTESSEDFLNRLCTM